MNRKIKFRAKTVNEGEWSEKTASFFLRHPAGMWSLSGAWGNESCEVIGNIHDNPGSK